MIKIYDRPEVMDLRLESRNLNDISDVTYNFFEDETNLYAEIIIEYTDGNTNGFHTVIDKSIYSNQLIMLTLFRPVWGTYFDRIVLDTKYYKVTHTYVNSTDTYLFNAASIWIPPSHNDPILIMPHVRTKEDGNVVEGSEYEEVELVNNDPQETLISLDPQLENKVNKWYVKKQMMATVLDPADSITYLEGQVDVLSKVINMLIEKTGLDVGEYKTILDSIDRNSVISVKPLDNINADIVRDKAKVRTVQKEYFNTTYGAE